MSTLLDFQFIAVLNLLVLLLWIASRTYAGDRRNALDLIMLILTVIAVVLNITFIVLKLVY